MNAAAKFGGLDPIMRLNRKVGASLNAVTDLHPILKLAGFGVSKGGLLDYAVKLQPQFSAIRIVLVGCGGTGSHLLPNILQYIWADHLKAKTPLPEIILVDGDVVEQKNLVRQKFTATDLGVNKAAALARRYTGAFGMKISAFEGFITDVAQLKKIAPYDKSNLIIGAVDNHRARKIIWEHHLGNGGRHPSFWVDGGNEGWHGQVVLGVHFSPSYYNNETYGTPWTDAGIGEKIGCVEIPNFFDEYATDFMKIGGVPVVPQNDCANMVEEEPQTIQANMMSAFCATQLVIQVLSKEIRTSSIYFDAKFGNTSAKVLTKTNLSKNFLAITESRKAIANFLVGLNLGNDDVLRDYPFLQQIERQFVV